MITQVTIRTSLSRHCAAITEDIANAKPMMSDQDLHTPPFKKRKVYRRRPQNEDNEDDSIHSHPTATASEYMTSNEPTSQRSRDADAKVYHEQEMPLTVAEILRQRKSVHRRRGGIEYRTVDTPKKNESSSTQAASPLLDKEDTLDKIITVVDRFAPQTGQVADVDQHMYAMPHLTFFGFLMHTLT